MRAAFAQARLALGQTWPNPAVGAIIVRNDGQQDELVACGRTMPGGRPHAERVAIEQAGDAARGATIYVSLEPCAHHAKTPPCVDAIIGAGISRVVVSAHDPDERVAGRGIEALNAAGVEVTQGCLESEGTDIVRGHVLRVTHNRPLVQLKLAVGSDGLIPQGRDGAPIWVTGKEARAHGHLLRARTDAILVGHGTVLADDPELTCRLPGLADKSPVRVVLSSDLAMPQNTKLLAGIDAAPVWIFGSNGADKQTENKLTKTGVEVLRVNRCTDSGLDVNDVLSGLARRGITRILIEGGPRVAASFWTAGVVDEVFIYKGPGSAGADGMPPLATGGLEMIENSGSFVREETRMLGGDTLDVYRRKDR